MENTLSRQMAKFAIKLKYSDLPENVVHEVKRYLYDSVGCAYGGYHTKDLNILRDIYKDMAGKGEATVIGFGDKIPAVGRRPVDVRLKGDAVDDDLRVGIGPETRNVGSCDVEVVLRCRLRAHPAKNADSLHPGTSSVR